jgi:hypothetical protein
MEQAAVTFTFVYYHSLRFHGSKANMTSSRESKSTLNLLIISRLGNRLDQILLKNIIIDYVDLESVIERSGDREVIRV